MWPTLLLSSFYLITASLPLLAPVARNLEYEYALLLAILLPLAIPCFILLVPRKYYTHLAQPYSHTLKALVHTFLIGPLVLLAPAVIIFATGNCPCSRTGFAFWFFIQVIPSWICTQAFIIYVVRRPAHYRKRPLVLATGLVLLVVIIGFAASLWFSPQKRAAHLLFGFIHGPIYDRLIEFDHGLLAVRIAHVLLAIILWNVARHWSQRRWWRLNLGWFVLWGIATFVANQYPSAKMGKAGLQEALPLKLEGEGFTLHYTSTLEQAHPSATPATIATQQSTKQDLSSLETSTPADASADEAISRLFMDTQFHILELKKLFKLPSYPHIDVYVYPDRTSKKLWFGGNATDVTDVVTPSVHLAQGRWPHPTLRHELVHALTSDIAFHGLGFHPNMAFTEGLAMAMSPQASNLSLHEGAYSLIQSGRVPEVEKLFSPLGFWSLSSQRAYTVVGSLVQYLNETAGVEKLMQLYAGQSWQDAVKASPKTVLDEWMQYLKKQVDVSRLELISEALYRFPGVLRDQCSHSKVDLSQPRSAGLYFRLRQPLGWNPDTDYAVWFKALHPHDLSPEYKDTYQQVKQLVTARPFNNDKLTQKLKEVQRAAIWPPKVLEHIEMELLNSDILRFQGERSQSIEVLQKLRDYSNQKFLGDQLTREIEARFQIEANLRPSDALNWRKFLAGWDTIPSESKSSHWVTDYLELRNRPVKSFTQKDLISKLNEPILVILPPTFYVEWYKRLAHHFTQLKDYRHASSAYQKAATLATAAERQLLEEHSRRSSYYANSSPTAQK